jgi:hypothetical protein
MSLSNHCILLWSEKGGKHLDIALPLHTRQFQVGSGIGGAVSQITFLMVLLKKFRLRLRIVYRMMFSFIPPLAGNTQPISRHRLRADETDTWPTCSELVETKPTPINEKAIQATAPGFPQPISCGSPGFRQRWKIPIPARTKPDLPFKQKRGLG